MPLFKNGVPFDSCYRLPWFCSDHCKMHYDRDEFHGDEALWMREQVVLAIWEVRQNEAQSSL